MWQIVGHRRAVRLLQNSIDANRVSHAYLLSGPRHIGKFTLAKEFAKALNCTEEAARPCGQCRSCRKIDRGVHPDVQSIDLEDGSKNISIDAVRRLQEGVALRPAEGRTKVYLLREAERLSEAAANSLLKTLEEPPPSVVMVLTTLDATMLLPTLVSRCQQIGLRPIPTKEIEAVLRQRFADSPERARLLATLARGRMGWALQAASNPSILDGRNELLDRLAAGIVSQRAKEADDVCLQCEIYFREQCQFGDLGSRECFYQRHRGTRDETRARAGSPESIRPEPGPGGESERAG